MEILAVAAASLLQPFLKELTSAGVDAVERASKETGNALRTYAARLWRRLSGRPDFGLDGEMIQERPELPAGSDPDPRLVDALKQTMRALDRNELAEIEAILRAAERHGGPRLESGNITQNFRGDDNVTIGQNQGSINISRG